MSVSLEKASAEGAFAVSFGELVGIEAPPEIGCLGEADTVPHSWDICPA